MWNPAELMTPAAVSYIFNGSRSLRLAPVRCILSTFAKCGSSPTFARLVTRSTVKGCQPLQINNLRQKEALNGSLHDGTLIGLV